ncbi:NYN domain-containing protein [Candidatus Synechococcus calcipolaris G9]|uniref:NYN domain-containing protein n=1 Tax=Candidatus Synechococcus calcipolaris G9 TaxID=1497997 RepID=A0ABT6EZ34_9SYNE|nr:NYN domain-containing protein [Candidatus Synechococcus calcipolaris]MDG2990530.1 NYN domain-containing protein [Candidatus Synechococcus calcipolaris G9]
MKVNYWLIPPVGALLAGAIALAALPNRPRAALVMSSLGALGGAYFTEASRRSRSELKSSKDLSQLTLAVQSLETKLKEQVDQLHQQQQEQQSQVNDSLATLAEHHSQLAQSVGRLEQQIQAQPTPSLGGQAAIFYDIENLIKGYAITFANVKKISLQAIRDEVCKTDKIKQILVQRAYANWSAPRLDSMRREMHQMGIEPVQVFGFSYENRKNAADIQLAIDVTNMIEQNPLIDTYVIVSGDGGFGSLAKKLREYGKTVIGCSYTDAAGKSFQAICDAFIHIQDPTLPPGQALPPEPPILTSPKDAKKAKSNKANSKVMGDRPQRSQPEPPKLRNQRQTRKRSSARHGSSSGDSHPKAPESSGSHPSRNDHLDADNARLVEAIARVYSDHPDDALTKTKEILDWYRQDEICGPRLAAQGLYIKKVQQAVEYLIPDFQPLTLGMVQFSEYMRYVCQDSPFCVARDRHQSNTPKLALRDSLPTHFKLEANFSKRPLHQPQTYRGILAKTNFSPPILTSSLALNFIANWLINHLQDSMNRDDLIEQMLYHAPASVGRISLEHGIKNYIAAAVLVSKSREISLSGDYISPQHILDDLKTALQDHLTPPLAKINESVKTEIIDQLLALPENPSELSIPGETEDTNNSSNENPDKVPTPTMAEAPGDGPKDGVCGDES